MSLVRGSVDLVDSVESVESMDLVDLVDLCGFSKRLALTVCLGIQVEWLSSLSPFSGYKQVSLLFLFKVYRSIPDRGRPAVASSVQKIAWREGL